jgi:hypothetical protein
MRTKYRSVLGALMLTLALCGLTATSALAAGAPTAETKPVAGVTETGATLVGVVNPNEAETTYYFEYGPTTSYGSKTSELTTLTKKSVLGAAKGLTRKTTYHFRLVAKNAYGTSYGADETFTTAAEKPEVVVSVGKVTELETTLSGGNATVELGRGTTMSCESHETTFHFTSSKEVEGRMWFHHCISETSACYNGNEVIESEPLKGRLGYTNKAKKEVGLILEGKSSNVWAKNVHCFGWVGSLTESLGGSLSLPVNTKIPTSRSFSMVYKEEKGKQTTGELGGQLLYTTTNELFGINGPFLGKFNKEFEIQA